MTHDQHLEAFLAICREMFERMEREGTWPWPDDSPNSDNVLKLGDNLNSV